MRGSHNTTVTLPNQQIGYHQNFTTNEDDNLGFDLSDEDDEEDEIVRRKRGPKKGAKVNTFN